MVFVLLGQYRVSQNLTGELSDLYSGKHMRLEVGDEGLLWVVGGQERSLPLLTSTEKLLRALQHPLPGKLHKEGTDRSEEEGDVVVENGNVSEVEEEALAQEDAAVTDEKANFTEDEETPVRVHEHGNLCAEEGPQDMEVDDGVDEPLDVEMEDVMAEEEGTEETPKSHGTPETEMTFVLDEEQDVETDIKVQDGEGEQEQGGDATEKAPAAKSSNKKGRQKQRMPPEDEPFQWLHRCKGSVELILQALIHIHSFHRESPHGKKNRGVPYHQRRLAAMEHQRDRLRQQISSLDDQDEANAGEQDKDLTTEVVVNNPWFHLGAADNPWIHLARVLNSLRIMTPILLRMFMHPRRSDASLVIQGVGLHPRKKPACWLLGEQTFDICLIQTYRKLCKRLVELYIPYGVAEKDVTLESTVWRDALHETMSEIALQTGTSVHGVSSPSNGKLKPRFGPRFDQHPFCKLSEDEQIALNKLTSQLDENFGLNEDKDADEHRHYLNSVNALHKHISKLLKSTFPDATLSVYGSCLSDLSLGKSSDVDMSFHMDSAQQLKEDFENGNISASRYERGMKDMVHKVCRRLRNRSHEFRDMNPVTRARVMVVNGTYIHAKNPHSEDGSMAFDICFLNDIAVANSSLLREYSLVDPRAKQLMILVKRWAKENKISSAKDSTFSSYTWTNLVIFYLQNIGFLPNLQSKELMERAGVSSDKNNRWHSINNLDTFYVTWEQASSFWKQRDELASMSVTGLLYGFFYFYAVQFPGSLYLISIKRSQEDLLPKTVFHQCSFHFVIEDPFETYDSHCPHNLANHANEKGMRKIVNCLEAAEIHLKKSLWGAMENGNEDIQCLWAHSGDQAHNTDGGEKKKRHAGRQGRPAFHRKKNVEKQKDEQRATKPHNGLHDAKTNGHDNGNFAKETASAKANVSESPASQTDESTNRKEGESPNAKKKANKRRNRGGKKVNQTPDAQQAPINGQSPAAAKKKGNRGGKRNRYRGGPRVADKPKSQDKDTPQPMASSSTGN